MIISQTPLRISLFGGGTDFHPFYSQHGGAILGGAIDKYVYVIAKTRFDNDIYVNYSKKEIVHSPLHLQHELVRESLLMTKVSTGIEITTLADIPSQGSGLGSSSSVTVGLLNALYAYQRQQVTADHLALSACDIEISRLRKPIGRQDQYLAAFGALSLIEFTKHGDVIVNQLNLSPDCMRSLSSNLLLFYTNRTRKSSGILEAQTNNIPSCTPTLLRMKELAFIGKDLLLQGKYDDLGHLLHESWCLKKTLAPNISDPQIDHMYSLAMRSGAYGGKIAGAGGGGFLLLYCPKQSQDAVVASLSDYKQLTFQFRDCNAKIAFNIHN
jgi:D-glycero-alpha-D-manno-heptose-7-phosphate kinase